MLTLHDFALSADCYKVRLLLSVLGVAHDPVPVDCFPGGENRSPAFRRLNPLGEVPVIEDEGFVLYEATAILVYLAGRYDAGGGWYPRAEPQALGEIGQWLAFSARLAATAGVARLAEGFLIAADVAACRAGAHGLLQVLDEHLWFRERAGGAWLCARPAPTLADIACFPDVMLSEEGGIARQDYPSVRRWTDRVKRIPGFTVMPGVFPAGPA
ncbi:glutathione S-transferase [Pseudoxanthobacter sp.]|uniref:glutathione S-transferase family protein n=1 Tax=Pseudoxanthobacter sp. TaxID=1925742 RepID=UPI002FE11349